MVSCILALPKSNITAATSYINGYHFLPCTIMLILNFHGDVIWVCTCQNITYSKNQIGLLHVLTDDDAPIELCPM